MEWTRSTEGDLHILRARDCPIRLLEELARAAGTDVTVENLRPVRAVNEWFESTQPLWPGGPVGRRRLRNATFDAALSNAEFLEMMTFWDRNGVYAVFTERSPVAFQASELEDRARYRALRNFGFVMEFAMPGPASDGGFQVVSPRPELIDLAEAVLAEHS